jgi:hypothetical protein
MDVRKQEFSGRIRSYSAISVASTILAITGITELILCILPRVM